MGQSASTNLATYSLLSTAPEATSHDPLAELGREVSYERSIGSSRCLRAIKARQQRKDGLAAVLVVKVFFKPGGGSSVSLKPFSKRLKAQRDLLVDVPNALPYARILETERAGYVLRPWAASSLYDRISTRPFLTLLEKKWIAFQLLTALSMARRQKVPHGDIKSENVLVTSSLWVYLTDFSSPYKPTMLPLDDPAEFSYFFDSSGRRTCYLAPERFYPSSQQASQHQKPASPSPASAPAEGKDAMPKHVTEAMDVFSAGCVLAELFCDGVPPFSLSQLFRYRNGEYKSELDTYLGQIEDLNIRDMCHTMLSIDPVRRGAFVEHLENPALPPFFPAFHELVSSLQQVMSFTPPTLPPPSSAASTSTPLPTTTTTTTTHQPTSRLAADAAAASAPQLLEPTLHSASDEVIERLSTDWAGVVSFLQPGAPVSSESSDLDAETLRAHVQDATPFPMTLAIPGFEITLPSSHSLSNPKQDDPAALLFLTLISANVRSCLRPSSTLRALELLLYLSRTLTDETSLDRILPYIIYFLGDDVASVRAMAIRSLTQLLLLVEVVTPANISVIMDYVLPNVRPLANDPDDHVRTAYAWCLASLADCGERFMSMMGKVRAMDKASTGRDELEETALESSYDAKMEELRDVIQEQLGQLLLTDAEPAVRRAVLDSVAPLCFFFGRNKSADVLLRYMVTFLNELDWQLRAAFFESAVGVVSYIGLPAVEDVIIPLMQQSLTDAEEHVTHRVLLSLTTLSELGLVPKARVWELLEASVNLICHPNIWIRQTTAAFLASLSRSMDPIDAWSMLYPYLRRLLRADLQSLEELQILDKAKTPLSRTVYEAALSWAVRSRQKSAFWAWSTDQKASKNAGLLPESMQKTTDAGYMLSEEDSAQLDRLRVLGLTTEDEIKLDMMRRQISKVAAAKQAGSLKEKDSAAAFLTGIVTLRSLNVTPTNILITQSDSPARDSASGRLLSPRPSTSDAGARRPGSTSDFYRPGRNFSDTSAIDDLRRRLALGAGPSTTSVSSVAKSPREEDPADIKHQLPGEYPSETPSPSAETQPFFSSPVSALQAPRLRNRVSDQGVAIGRASPALGKVTAAAVGELNSQMRSPNPEDEAVSTQAESSRGPASEAHFSAPSDNMPKRFSTNYEGRDPAIRLLLERTYLEHSHRRPPEFGPYVSSGIPKRRAVRNSLLAREKSSQSRPEGTLIGHLAEHTGAIVGLVSAPDNVFFISASKDGTARVWDSMRLERNVTSRSRHTLNIDSPCSAVCRLEHTHCVCIASENGALAVYRINIKLDSGLPKHEKPELVRQYNFRLPGEYATAMAHYQCDGISYLACATSKSFMRILDLASMREEKTFSLPPSHGPFTSICVDPKQCWIAAGTATGHLALWDLRFDLLLKTIPLHAPDQPSSVISCTVHPSKGKGRWLVVSLEAANVGDSAVQVWDIEHSRMVQEFFTKGASAAGQASTVPERPADESSISAATAIERFLQQPSPSVEDSAISSTVRAITLGSDYTSIGDSAQHSVGDIGMTGETSEDAFTHVSHKTAYMLTGGDDRLLRWWDLGAIERSGILLSPEDSTATTYCSRQPEDAEPGRAKPTVFEETAVADPPKTRPTIVAHSQQNMLRAHQDAITAVALLQLPYKLILTGDRKGIIKVSS